MHTAQISACAQSDAAQMVRAYKDKNYAGIIVTDHFINGNSTVSQLSPWDVKMRYFVTGYEIAKKAGDECGLDVFLGWEFSIRGIDLLTYGLDLGFLLAHPGLDRLSASQYSFLVRKNGGYLAQAHPFRDAWYIHNAGPVDWRVVDGVEIHNSADSDATNAKSRAFAQEHDLPIQAGGDTHSVRDVQARCAGVILNSRANSIFDIIDAIVKKEASLAH
ncbi:MAG: histidinol phosphatase [Oscillospiraceae bacterium]|nr:histidinol phosphatase [Oscillospiraceae bacterium]